MGQKSLDFAFSPRFGVYLNPISGWGIWLGRFDSEIFKECFDKVRVDINKIVFFLSKFETYYYKFHNLM